jgi:hypothetical protein
VIIRIDTATNPVFHEHTKQIEVDYNFTRDKLVNKEIITPYVMSEDQ